jgi:hypothetical protein
MLGSITEEPMKNHESVVRRIYPEALIVFGQQEGEPRCQLQRPYNICHSMILSHWQECQADAWRDAYVKLKEILNEPLDPVPTKDF